MEMSNKTMKRLKAGGLVVLFLLALAIVEWIVVYLVVSEWFWNLFWSVFGIILLTATIMMLYEAAYHIVEKGQRKNGRAKRRKRSKIRRFRSLILGGSVFER